METLPKKIILAFGKMDAIKTWVDRLPPFHPPVAIIQKRHEYHDIRRDQEVECVHCGSWDAQTYNLYLEAVAYFKTITVPSA
jgi:hypothetical protein